METEIKIDLWECVGVFVIVCKQTGVYYSNQVGGTACAHPEVEGFLIPMDRFHGYEEDISKLTLDAWGRGSLDRMLSDVEKDQLEELVQGFQAVGCDWRPALDRDRLKDGACGEAWVPVRTPYGLGWLTWENSD